MCKVSLTLSRLQAYPVSIPVWTTAQPTGWAELGPTGATQRKQVVTIRADGEWRSVEEQEKGNPSESRVPGSPSKQP